jgi:Mn-containing catalase
MFSHDKRLQFEAKPERPDPVFARRLQEVIGGQYGEITVMNQYLFQGWNCRHPGKYKDLIMDTGVEEIGHVEMLATMVARLLEGAPLETQEAAMASDPSIAAVIGGMNPQHAIVTGSGAAPRDSNGIPWSGAFIIASGNLLADFYANVNAEAQGRLQVARLYHMTDDRGVKDLLKFLLARDTMHQNQWLAAIEELKTDGLETLPVPGDFPNEEQHEQYAYQLWNFSSGQDSRQGGWASGPTPDGRAEFGYVEEAVPMAMEPMLPAGDPRLYNTGSPPGPKAKKAVENVVKKITPG